MKSARLASFFTYFTKTFYYLTIQILTTRLPMLQKTIEWLESRQRTCFFKEHFGIDCPGCGLQRSFIELLKGHFLESISLYPALIPTIIMFLFLFLHIILKFKHGALILKYMFITNMSLIFVHYIYKLIIM